MFKYARAVKQKVWNDAENRERDWVETLKIGACEAREVRARKGKFMTRGGGDEDIETRSLKF